MTSRDFIAAEADNTDRIILYREGLFWKAYERSAFALCSQVRPLKPTRKVLKSLNGGDLISVGFPSAGESSTLGGLAVIERSDDRLTVSAPRPLDEREFRVWKNAIPVKVPVPKTEPVGAASVQDASAAFRGAAASGVDGMAGSPDNFTSTASSDTSALFVVRQGRVSLWGRLRRLFGHSLSAPAAVGVPTPVCATECRCSSASLRRVARALEGFELANKTPMECMSFVSELKNMLVER